MARFIPADRHTAYLLPPTVEDWLPEGHLARFVAEIVDKLDLSKLERAYAGRGSDAHHPAVLLGLLIYGYATGVYSSRAIERATYDSLAFRYLAANTHPDHDTLNTFRQRFLEDLKAVFLQVLQIAAEMKLVTLGTISLDGTKVKANASKHRALSYGHAQALAERLKAEIAELLRRAEQAEAVPDHVSLPDELARREQRLAAIEAATAKIEARAQERLAAEQAAYDAKRTRREAQRAVGQKPRGKEPQPPAGGPKASDQINLTDEESRILPVSGGGFEQGYNAQVAVDAESLLIVAQDTVQAANDKRQVAPMLAQLAALPAVLGQAERLLADNGYFSAANVTACEQAAIAPLIALGREAHTLTLAERLSIPPPPPETADAVTRMAHTLKTPQGRAQYGRRKCTVEPVFGIIKHVMRFRQFLLRGLTKVRAEWTLVCLAWNVKRLAVLSR
jgi:transposase